MAVIVAEVAATLVKAVNDVALRRTREGDFEVVEVCGGSRVDYGGEDRVDVRLVRCSRGELELRASAVDEVSGGGS